MLSLSKKKKIFSLLSLNCTFITIFAAKLKITVKK